MNARITIALLVVCIGVAKADTRWIKGTYRNPALGYSIRVPHGLKGMTGDQAGPERGISIALPSGGEIVVFGEPNSFEWKTPAEGIRHELEHYACTSGQEDVSSARIGRLSGARGRLLCGDRVLKVLLAFRTRTGDGPIYWLRLETTRVHESEDDALFANLAASLKMIRWQ